MMAIQEAAYVATISPSHLSDFVAKVEKAATVKDGLVYLHMFTGCPTGWGIKTHETIEYMRKAVESRYFLLYEYRAGEFTISAPTKNIKQPKDVSEFINGQKRFSHLSEEEVTELRDYSNRRWDLLQRLATNLS